MDNILLKEIKTRQQNCLLAASDRAFDALLVIGKGPERTGDLRYLANHAPMLPGHPRRYGFRGRGHSFLLLPIDSEPIMMVTTPFYEKEIAIQDVRYSNNLISLFGETAKEKKLQYADIGIVGTDILPVALYRDLTKELPHVKFYPADDIVMNLRSQKSSYEIEQHRRGAYIADITAKEVKKIIAPGKTEREIGNLITSVLSSHGVTNAFATCQSGERSKEPYDLEPCSDKVIENGDMVHMEINGLYNGYQIDICRSTVVGDMNKEQELILELTCKMLEEAIAAVKPGIKAEDLEFITGKIALENDLGPNHTATYGGPGTYLGHAIGLGVDEPPVLAKGDKTILKPGMVLTIEPGIYRTPWGGCRIEDEVLVTKEGHELLNHYGRRFWL